VTATESARHARIDRMRLRLAGHERRRDVLLADGLVAEAKVEAFFATLIRGRLAALERDDEPDASGAL
jgi:hypothetical protein